MKFVKKQLGVTFLELLTVVGIIAVISMMTYPSYQRYSMRVNRVEVRNAMDEIAQKLEQNFSITRNFKNYYDTKNPNDRAGTAKSEAEMLAAFGYDSPVRVPETRTLYEITLHYIETPKSDSDTDNKYGPGFYLEAIAVGKQVNDKCKALYLNHRNVRKALNDTGTSKTAWAAQGSRDSISMECWQS